MQPPAQKVVEASVTVVEEESTVVIPPEKHALLQKRLTDLLCEKGAFVPGPDLVLKWHFVQFNEGSQAARYFLGFGAGKGSLAVEAQFLDATGKQLAHIRTEGEISGGFFGGTFDAALNKAADEIANYAKKNFR